MSKKFDTIRDIKRRGARRRQRPVRATERKRKRGVKLMQTYSLAFLAGVFV